MNKLFLVSICVLLLSCGSESEKSEDVSLISWLSKDVSSYSFYYEETGFTPMSGSVWEIHVVDDEVFDVVYVGGGDSTLALTADTAPTISDLFDKIASCKSSGSCRVTVEEYDLYYMYPVIFRASNGEEGSGFNVSNFVLLQT